MAWTLIEMLTAMVSDLEPYKLALAALKAAAGSAVGVILKRLWGLRMNGKKCMIGGCYRNGAPAQLGLCLVCYSRAKKKVEAGETTWEELKRLGLCGGESDVFDQAFRDAKQQPQPEPTKGEE